MNIIDYRLSQIDSSIPNDISTLQSIELNIIELCNRRCVFCPRNDPTVYYNRDLKMSIDTAHNIGKKLKNISYKYRIGFSGFGEPILHPNIIDILKIIFGYIKDTVKTYEISSNGDILTEDVILKLYDSGITKIMVNLYDGEYQVEKFENLFSKLNISKNLYILRHNYCHNDDKFRLILNNRSGMSKNVEVLGKLPMMVECYFPFYKMFIDWDGSLGLCQNDWGRKSDISKSLLNINTHSIHEMWMSDEMNKYRRLLLKKDRSISPCRLCNTHGTLIGEQQFEYFKYLFV